MLLIEIVSTIAASTEEAARLITTGLVSVDECIILDPQEEISLSMHWPRILQMGRVRMTMQTKLDFGLAEITPPAEVTR